MMLVTVDSTKVTCTVPEASLVTVNAVTVLLTTVVVLTTAVSVMLAGFRVVSNVSVPVAVIVVRKRVRPAMIRVLVEVVTPSTSVIVRIVLVRKVVVVVVSIVWMEVVKLVEREVEVVVVVTGKKMVRTRVAVVESVSSVLVRRVLVDVNTLRTPDTVTTDTDVVSRKRKLV